MQPQLPDRIHAANTSITDFLAKAVVLLPADRKPGTAADLSEIQSCLDAVMATIEELGESLGRSGCVETLDAPSKAEIRLYVENLERLRSAMLDLKGYAETRRDQLAAEARKISEAIAWTNTLKLTTLE